MLLEHQLVPYQTKKLPNKPLLVFAPHPDDEVFGMGGALLLAKEAGTKIKIIYVTLGEKAGNPETRKKEAKTICELLNAEYRFLSYSDREVQATHRGIQAFRDIILAHPEYHIYFPSPIEYHPDHRAVAALVWRGAQEAKHKQPLFSYEISRQSEANLLVDITSVSHSKTDLMSVYK